MQHHSNQFEIKFSISQQLESSEPLQGALPSPLHIKHWHFKHRKSIYTSVQDVKNKRKYNSLHWDKQENQKYASFLCSYIDLAKGSIKQKRKYHLNRMLSKYIGTRSPVQCRSHHQKMLRSFGSLQGIIANLTSRQVIIDHKSTQATDQNSTQNVLIFEPREQNESLEAMIEVNFDFSKENQTIKCINDDGDGDHETRSLWDILSMTNCKEYWILQ